VLKGSEGVAGSLLGNDAVLLAGVSEGGVASGRRRGRAKAELELTGAAGGDARMREREIGWVGELQGVVVVL
jgi:hypothetical protein